MAFALASVVMSTADAPSVRKDEFPAVTVPCGLTNAGFSDAWEVGQWVSR